MMVTFDVCSSLVTSVPLWWEMLIVGEAIHVEEEEICGKFLYIPLSCAVNLKLTPKIKYIKKKQ